MKHGHVQGTKREATSSQATLTRLQALGLAIQQAQQGRPVDELLAGPAWQPAPTRKA